MPDDATPHLGLPYIAASQAQKHVTHNEALHVLDSVVQLAVLDQNLTAPPGSPAEGDRYIVAASPTGAWAGQAGKIAAYVDTAWNFYTPGAGWIAFVVDEATLYFWNGTAWASMQGIITALQNLTLLGIGATADATNPFSAKLNKALWTAKYAADGGDGDLRYTMNKETTSDTVSLLFQKAFSGRAEVGLIGDDNLSFKVSPDGSAWTVAAAMDKTTGLITLVGDPTSALHAATKQYVDSHGGGRELLTAARTYYVRTDGSDSNTGLVDSAAGAFLTVQKAIDAVASLDLNIYDATIQIKDGTYTGANVFKSLVGAGKCIIRGNAATPANVLLSITGADCFSTADGCVGMYYLKDFKMVTTASGSCIRNSESGCHIKLANLDFGACVVSHIYSNKLGAIIQVDGSYAISGGAAYHYIASNGGSVLNTVGSAATVTLTGTPAFSAIFALAQISGLLQINIAEITFSGAATGKRFAAKTRGFIYTSGGGLTYFPGSVAGTLDTGGGYDGYIPSDSKTVGALPSAAIAGQRYIVTDTTVTTFSSVVVGGGTNTVPVYSDGTNWKIG